jgi:hypothetical protein
VPGTCHLTVRASGLRSSLAPWLGVQRMIDSTLIQSTPIKSTWWTLRLYIIFLLEKRIERFYVGRRDHKNEVFDVS